MSDQVQAPKLRPLFIGVAKSPTQVLDAIGEAKTIFSVPTTATVVGEQTATPLYSSYINGIRLLNTSSEACIVEIRNSENSTLVDKLSVEPASGDIPGVAKAIDFEYAPQPGQRLTIAVVKNGANDTADDPLAGSGELHASVLDAGIG